jgi:DNA mismatch repair protein MLH1
VHPTKREVHFLHEDAVVEAVADAIQAALVQGEGAKSRVFEYQVRRLRPGDREHAAQLLVRLS